MDNKEFEDVVYKFISAYDGNDRLLAIGVECAESTVIRWANGMSRPHPKIQQYVLKWIKDHS